MTIFLAILMVLLVLAPYYILIYLADRFTKENKIEVYVTDENEETFKIAYKNLTFARAVELKKEYESEGFLVEILVQARKEKKWKRKQKML